jgi:hypothetical protein
VPQTTESQQRICPIPSASVQAVGVNTLPAEFFVQILAKYFMPSAQARAFETTWQPPTTSARAKAMGSWVIAGSLMRRDGQGKGYVPTTICCLMRASGYVTMMTNDDSHVRPNLMSIACVEKVADALSVEAAAGAVENVVVLLEESVPWCKSSAGTLGAWAAQRGCTAFS